MGRSWSRDRGVYRSMQEQGLIEPRVRTVPAIPADGDVAGWTALSEQMKRAADEALAKGHIDEADAYRKRSAACAEQAQRARTATSKDAAHV